MTVVGLPREDIMHASDLGCGGTSGFWLSQIKCRIAGLLVLEDLHIILRHVKIGLYPTQVSTTWLSSYKDGLLKLSDSHVGFRGWAKEAVVVSLAEVDLPTWPFPPAPANIVVERKVKCDEAKPACERCNKATYKCAGYDQPWLDEAPYEREAQRRSLVRDKLHQTRHNAFLPKEAVTSQGFLPAEKVAQELNLSAFQEDICRSFMFHKLCSGDMFSKAISWWLNPAPRVELQSRTLVSASKAMTAAFFGRIHQQPRIITQGTLQYTEALRNLTSDLSHKVKAFTFETLGATMALNMYEVCHCSSYVSR